MSSIQSTSVEQELSPLSRLEVLLRDGRLAQAVQQKALGASLSAVNRELVEKKLTQRVLALVPGGAQASARLDHRPVVSQRIKQILGVGKALTDAAGQRELDSLPEKIRNAALWRDEVDREFRAAWQRSVEETFESRKKLAGLLCRFEATTVLGRELQQIADQGLGTKHSFPPAPEVVAEVIRLASEQERVLAELRQQTEGQHLLAFLDHVLDETATLEHVTPELMVWLRTHGAAKLLKIRL